MAAYRGRLSFWDTLPDWAEPARLLASKLLNENKLTQLDILDQVNGELRRLGWEEGVTDPPQASRSSLNRLSMKLAGLSQRMRDARAMFEGLSAHLDHDQVDESSIILGEFLKTLVLELNVDGAATDPKGAMELARAYLAAVQGQKISADRRAKLQREYEAKTAKVIDTVAKEAGLSKETISKLRREFLGVRPKKGSGEEAGGGPSGPKVRNVRPKPEGGPNAAGA